MPRRVRVGTNVTVNSVQYTRKPPTRDEADRWLDRINSGLMHRNKFVLFATSLPRSIGCAITGLIATAVFNHAGRHADVWSNADSWVAKPSQAVQYRRN